MVTAKSKNKTKLGSFIELLKAEFDLQKYLEDESESKVKKYRPFDGYFVFTCSDCIIECAKSRLGMEYPELISFNTHVKGQKATDSDSFMRDHLAYLCLVEMVEQLGFSDFLSFSTPNFILNADLPAGAVLIGAELNKIKQGENLHDFHLRIAECLSALGVNQQGTEGHSVDSDEQNAAAPSPAEKFLFAQITDVLFYLESNSDGTQEDDFDMGRDVGQKEGYDMGGHHTRVALFKLVSKNSSFLNGPRNEIFQDLIETVSFFQNSKGNFPRWSLRYLKFVEENGIDEIGEFADAVIDKEFEKKS